MIQVLDRKTLGRGGDPEPPKFSPADAAGFLASFAENVVVVEESEAERHGKQLQRFAEEVAGSRTEPARMKQMLSESLKSYKLGAEKRIHQMRLDLAATAEALQEYVTVFAGQGQDQERRLDQELGRLSTLRQKKSLEEVQTGLGEVCETLSQTVRQIKTQNQLVVGQLRDEIRTLQRRLEQAERRGDRAQGNLSHRLAFERRIQERIERDEIFCLFLVRVLNWNAILETETKDFAMELMEVVSARLKELLGRETFAGRWYDGYFAAIVPMDKRAALEGSEALARSMTRKYAVTVKNETRQIDIKARTAVLDHVKGQTPEHMLRRVDQLIRAFES